MRKYIVYVGFVCIVLPVLFFSSCGQDRSGEYYAFLRRHRAQLVSSDHQDRSHHRLEQA